MIKEFNKIESNNLIFSILPILILFYLFNSNSINFTSKTKLLLTFLLVILLLLPPLIFTSNNKLKDYGLSNQNIFIFFLILDKILLSNLNKDFNYNKSNKSIIPKPFSWKRFKWSIKLYTSMRGINWNFQLKSLPHDQSTLTSTSRTTFCLKKLISSIIHYILIDLISTPYMRSSPYFLRQIPLSSLPFHIKYFNLLSSGLIGYLVLNLMYELITILSVLSQFWTIEENLNLFGSLKESYTIRGFWGKTWHQALRNNFTAPGKYLTTTILHLPPSSPLSNLIQLISTFLMSALQHCYSMYSMNQTGLGSFKFFIIQPIGILLEGFFLDFFIKKLGLKGKGWKLIGFIWTLGWILWSSEWFIDELVQGGFWELNPAPFTLVGGLKDDIWWNPN